jgi:voltage-gated potassium channel
VLSLIIEHVLESQELLVRSQIFIVINWVFTVLFALELLLRWIAQQKKIWFFRIYWLDIIAVIAPMFRALRLLRILRLLRMFRLGKLLNRRFSSLQSVFRQGVLQHFWLLLVLVTVVMAGAVSFHLAEGGRSEFQSFEKALWWSIFTLVGGEPITGDPAQTSAGRIVTLFVMLSSLVTFASLTGIIAAAIINKLKPRVDMGDMDIQDLENHIVICGWNRSLNLLIEVMQSAEDYQEQGVVVVAEFGEYDPDQVIDPAKIPHPSSLYVVKGDFTCSDVLMRVGIPRASHAIILADKSKPRSDQDRDARTVLAALLIEKLNPKIFTCVELLNRANSAHVKYAGVEEILVSDEYIGPILGNAQRTRGLIPILDELFDPLKGNQFYKISSPPDWIGKTVGEVFVLLKSEHDAILISLEVEEDSNARIELNPATSRVLTAEDRMVVIAKSRPKLK